MLRGAELQAIEPYVDSRGSLKKILMLSQLDQGSIGEVYLLYTEPGGVRGNHYHQRTLEYFAVVSGSVRILLRDMESAQEQSLALSSEDNLVLKVPPGLAHAFKNESAQQVIILAISTLEYDELNPDTYRVLILA